MKRASIRVQEPTPELIEKIRRARVAISQQKPRYLKCPYCQHNAIAVYEDTRGHRSGLSSGSYLVRGRSLLIFSTSKTVIRPHFLHLDST